MPDHRRDVMSFLDYEYVNKIGDLRDGSREWPMAAFNTPSYIVWGTIAAKLHKAGWSDDRIKEWLQSDDPRRDTNLVDILERAAKFYADKLLAKEQRNTQVIIKIQETSA